MNNQNPLSPQDSLSEQKNTGRARVKIVVFFVLAIHCVGLLAFLMAGCKKEQEVEPAVVPDVATNAEPRFEPYAPETNVPGPIDTNPPGTMSLPETNAAMIPTPGLPGTAAVVAPAGTTEYSIARGDSFSSIAKKFGVSVRAITDANPNVVPTKLQIGQKLQVPAPTAAPAPGAEYAPVSSPAPVAAASGSASSKSYTVKSGDTLSKIASQHRVTVKAVRSANNLKTDRIKVGQKLKIPVKAQAAPTPAPAAAPAPPSLPAMAPTPGPTQ